MPLNPAAFSLLKINLPQQPRQQGENKHKYRAGKFWLEHPGKANAPTSVCSSFRAKPPFFINWGPGEFTLQSIGPSLRGQAGCRREMRSQEVLTPPRTSSASFSKKCNSIMTLGDTEGLFVTGKRAHDVTGERQEGSQRLQKSTRWPVLHLLVSRQGWVQAGLQHPSTVCCLHLAPAFAALGRVG